MHALIDDLSPNQFIRLKNAVYQPLSTNVTKIFDQCTANYYRTHRKLLRVQSPNCSLSATKLQLISLKTVPYQPPTVYLSAFKLQFISLPTVVYQPPSCSLLASQLTLSASNCSLSASKLYLISLQLQFINLQTVLYQPPNCTLSASKLQFISLQNLV